MRDYTSETDNRRLLSGAIKDRLIEMIGREIERRNLKTKDLQAVVPTISARQVSDIRAGLRSAASIERLNALAIGLGLIENENESGMAA